MRWRPDGHSFPAVALPYDLDQTSEPAVSCSGDNAFHTPALVREALVEAATKEGYSIAVDAPFAGARVPLSAYRRVLSVMIEVNRRLYMDEATGARTARFAEVLARSTTRKKSEAAYTDERRWSVFRIISAWRGARQSRCKSYAIGARRRKATGITRAETCLTDPI